MEEIYECINCCKDVVVTPLGECPYCAADLRTSNAVRRTMKGNDGTGNIEDRDDWKTPKWLFDIINAQYDFTFDCCASAENTKCPNKYAMFFESISKDFLERETVWMNPPFSKAAEMFEHFFKVVKQGVAIYRCDNMEIDTWQSIILKNADWVVIPKGRINYEGKIGKGSRFPSALIGVGLPPFEMDDSTTLIVNRSQTLGGKK